MEAEIKHNEKLGVAWWWELIMHRPNKKSKNNNLSNSQVYGLTQVTIRPTMISIFLISYSIYAAKNSVLLRLHNLKIFDNCKNAKSRFNFDNCKHAKNLFHLLFTFQIHKNVVRGRSHLNVSALMKRIPQDITVKIIVLRGKTSLEKVAIKNFNHFPILLDDVVSSCAVSG